MTPTRRSLSARVRRGLATFAGLAQASSPAMLLGINENDRLTKTERQTIAEVEAAIAWIRHINAKKTTART